MALRRAREDFPEVVVRAQTTFLDAILGRKNPKEAVAAIIEGVKPLMPA